jgi:hypothetical protein
MSNILWYVHDRFLNRSNHTYPSNVVLQNPFDEIGMRLMSRVSFRGFNAASQLSKKPSDYAND